jgi:hypothetical protein
MKKFRFLVMIALLTTALAALTVPAQDDAENKCYEKWYDAAQTKKDAPLAARLGKECLDKFPQSKQAKFWQSSINKYLSTLRAKFYDDLKAYYGGPDAPKLNTLIESSEKFAVESQAFTGKSEDVGVISYTALATTFGAMSGSYPDMEKAKAWADKALPMLESTTPPPDWQADQYNTLRATSQAKLNQFLGFYQLKQSTPNYEQAESYLSKSAAVKSTQAGEGWKDPNNYWLRSDIYGKQYTELSAKYRALSADDQNGEPGKTLLAQINPVVDKMIMDYARVVALSTAPQAKPLQDAAREQLELYWKFKYSKTDGIADYIKGYETDPTVNQPLPPVPETAAPAKPAPGKPAPGKP